MNIIYNKKILILLALVFISSTISGKLKSESWLWTLNLGFTSIKSDATGESLNGYSFNSTIEKKIRNQPFAYGVNVSYLSADDQFVISNQGEKISSSISSTAVFLTAKYLFSKSEVVPYIGLGMGVNFAKNNIASNGFYTLQPTADADWSSEFTGLAVAVPIGVNYFPAENIPYFGINVVPTWTEKTFFSSNFNFLINLSLGFQF